ncbi:MAG: hypothetical protein JNK48_27295 [Bryobacterales bacterium]|nr:hypothetical protein [Bryobacterales bacterium]
MQYWSNLANDALYRCRATSIVLTYLTDSVAGDGALPHRLVNLGMHVVAAFLVAGLGVWRRIGFRLSVPAAAFFALREAHQEAVIWVAALPEVLAFVFVLAAVLSWIRWLDTRRPLWGAASLVAFVLGLLSKESAAVFPAFAVLIWWLEARNWRAPVAMIALFGVLDALYAYSIFSAKDNHLHLNDGTFTVQLGFLWTMVHSTLRLLWPWGAVALALLAWKGIRIWKSHLAGALVWIVIALLPYSFLTYMDRVPSRHTYLASVGIAVLMGCAWQTVREMRSTAVAAVALAAVLTHNLGYLWTKKYDQYQRRVEPTERFLRYAASNKGPVRITCAPYGYEVFRQAAAIRLGWSPEQVLGPNETPPAGEPAEYCDTSKP